jgi:hypothetical protein
MRMLKADRVAVTVACDADVRAKEAADAMREFVGEPRETAKRRPPSRQSRERAIEEVNRIRAAQDWASVTPTHAVALFAWCHAQVYGVPPGDLDGEGWTHAVFAAARMLKTQFNGDVLAFVAFLRWSWTRERSRETWRRANGGGGFRMTWRIQFSGTMMTDYRVDLLRQRSR